MGKVRLSVFIIAKNEADRIAPVIKSVKEIADEIIVIDSGSQDETQEISRMEGAKVVFNEWRGYGPQKVFGENLCKNDWVLNIDADEEVSPELAVEINKLKNGPIDDFIGWRVKIVNKFFGEKKPRRWAYYYNQLRLYNKKYCGFKDSIVHDSVIVKNVEKVMEIGQLKNMIAHQSFRCFGHWMDKINSYSEAQALDFLEKYEKGLVKKPSFLKVFLVPSVAFFKAYFIRRYFIYGISGLLYSYFFAFSRLAKIAKIRQKIKEL